MQLLQLLPICSVESHDTLETYHARLFGVDCYLQVVEMKERALR